MPLNAGDLLLIDAGAEYDCYASDITRTFPVAAKFTTRQREIYEIVLDAEVSAIASLRPGLTYQSVHLAPARRMAEAVTARWTTLGVNRMTAPCGSISIVA